MDISLLLEMGANAFPDRPAVSTPSDRFTLGRLDALARGGAQWLCGRPGDKLAYIGLNSVSFPPAIFAAGLAGRPFVPLNYRLPDADLRKLLARSAPAVAIVDEDIIPRVQGIDGIELVTPAMFLSHAEQSDLSAFKPALANETAILLFTSGTTGEPKAAILRHANLTSYIISTVEFMGAEEGAAALVSVPSYHIAGISAVLSNIYSGRRLVYLPAFSPDSWIDIVARESVTHAMVVPTMLDRILERLQERGETLPSLCALSYGGGRMPLPTIARAMEQLPHIDYVNAYGLTETSSTIAILGPQDHRAAIISDDPAVRRRLGSVGRPLPTIELEIRDENGANCPVGVAGEIHVRGEQVSGQYIGKSALTADGWFPTKDAGWLDKEGYLFVEGRLDDVIVRGGENISPGEIEDVLREHPAVEDVVVFGLPDDRWGERVAASIVSRKGLTASVDDLRRWVQKRLRSTKAPETWDLRDELPYTDTGKVLRRVIRAELTARLGLE